MSEPTTWLWYIERTDEIQYDTFESAVVAAHTEAEARHIHPGDSSMGWDGENWTKDDIADHFQALYPLWTVPDAVRANRIGRADNHVVAGSVVLASLNAG